MTNRLILGRSPNALIGAFAAVFNVFVVAHLPLAWDPAVVGAINAAFGTVVLLIATNTSIQVAAGNAAADRAAK